MEMTYSLHLLHIEDRASSLVGLTYTTYLSKLKCEYFFQRCLIVIYNGCW